LNSLPKGQILAEISKNMPQGLKPAFNRLASIPEINPRPTTGISDYERTALKASRAAAIVAAVSASQWAVDRNAASN
jgi:hypothetical protein